MTGDYQIVRVHNNPVAPDGGITGLEAAVKALTSTGWQAVGGPFYDPGLMQWCQAMQRPGTSEPGEVRLREPGVIQQGEMPRAHRDPKDGALKMREPRQK